MKKIIFIFTIVSLFILPYGNVFAETTPDSTTGFVSGNIWYSKVKLTEGDDVKIYTGFWNGENNPITIKIDFFDKETILGKREVTIPALTLKEVSIPWKVTSGDHQIRATISKATTLVNGANEEIVLSKDEVETPSIFIPKKITASVGAEKLEVIGEKVVNALPDSVAKPITESVKDVDLFREKTANTLEEKVAETKEEIKEMEIIAKGEQVGLKEGEINTDEIKGEAQEGEKITEEKKTDSKVTKPATNKTVAKKTTTNNTKQKDSLSGTERPIAYVQLFLLSAALFIFSHPVLFYGIIIVIAFFSIRFLYRKIRGK